MASAVEVRRSKVKSFMIAEVFFDFGLGKDREGLF